MSTEVVGPVILVHAISPKFKKLRYKKSLVSVITDKHFYLCERGNLLEKLRYTHAHTHTHTLRRESLTVTIRQPKKLKYFRFHV